MPYKYGQPTLLGFICSPFIGLITKKQLFGSQYVHGVDYLGAKSQLYKIGAALGHAFQNKMDTLINFLFVPDTETHKANEVVRLCKKDAHENLEKYKSEFGQEPETFDDFTFYWSIENLIKKESIRLSPREAFEAYLNDDKRIKKLFEAKVNAKGIGKKIMITLLDGIYFGSTFPKLTEDMFQNAYNDNDKDFWAILGHGLTVPGELEIKSLEETENYIIQIAEVYTSKYYPELTDPLGIQRQTD